MVRLTCATARRALGKVVIVISIVALTVLAMRLLGPQPTRGQSANLGDVQVTSLTLVGTDGSVLATLAPGAGGNGHLTLFDTAGQRRVSLEGSNLQDGAGLALYGSDGQPRLQVFYSIRNGLGGVRFLGANGQPRLFATLGTLLDGTEAGNIGVYDPDGHPRASLGTRREDGSFGVVVRDADGNIIDALPPLAPSSP